jgi:hypothetical protein
MISMSKELEVYQINPQGELDIEIQNLRIDRRTLQRTHESMDWLSPPYIYIQYGKFIQEKYDST